jgi:hypothetical protein
MDHRRPTVVWPGFEHNSGVYLGDSELETMAKDRQTPPPDQKTYMLVRPTYIACINPRYANVASSHELARQMEGRTYVDLPTGHNAMLSIPGERETQVRRRKRQTIGTGTMSHWVLVAF